MKAEYTPPTKRRTVGYSLSNYKQVRKRRLRLTPYNHAMSNICTTGPGLMLGLIEAIRPGNGGGTVQSMAITARKFCEV
jgi:hypothetical protein